MSTLHDPNVRASLLSRLDSLGPDAQRRWGIMRVDQMLWHVNESLEQALGRVITTRSSKLPPLPKPLMRFATLNFPWPKGRAATSPELVARETYDFAKEKARTVRLIDEVASRELHSSWPSSATFGTMTGRSWSRLQAKHLDHHLKQFGV